MFIDAPLVVGVDGARGRLESALPASRDGHVVVRLEDGTRLMVPAAALEPSDDGQGYRMPLTRAQIETVLRDHESFQEGHVHVIPVIEEELEVGKGVEEVGRVRLTKRVHTRTQSIDEPLRREHVELQRVRINRYVDSMPSVRTEGDVLVVPVVEEVVVYEKRLVLREELHISKTLVEEPAHLEVEVHRETVEIERVEGQSSNEEEAER